MHEQLSLLGWTSRSPNPGHRGVDTSIEAAKRIAHKSTALFYAALAHIKSCGDYGATADEAAAALGEDILNIRPRFTDLKSEGFIKDSGQRRENIKGNTQRVWITV